MVSVLVAAVTVAAVGGCGRPLGGRVVYQGDYPSYQSVAELLDKADLVVEVTVANPRVGKLYPSGEVDPPEESAVVITIYQATVTKVHKGQEKPGNVFEVKQMGGQSDGVLYEQEGQIPFQEGKPYLLFLETYPDAPASLLNPTQAQYEIDPTGAYRPLGDNTLTPTDLTP